MIEIDDAFESDENALLKGNVQVILIDKRNDVLRNGNGRVIDNRSTSLLHVK